MDGELIIDPRRCYGCAACITICPTRALDLIDHLAVVEMPKCTLCGLCPASCPVHAITLED